MSSLSDTPFLLLYYMALYIFHHYGEDSPSYKLLFCIFSKYVSRYSKSENNDFLDFKFVDRTFVLFSMHATPAEVWGPALVIG
jgi:hypothetical protein